MTEVNFFPPAFPPEYMYMRWLKLDQPDVHGPWPLLDDSGRHGKWNITQMFFHINFKTSALGDRTQNDLSHYAITGIPSVCHYSAPKSVPNITAFRPRTNNFRVTSHFVTQSAPNDHQMTLNITRPNCVLNFNPAASLSVWRSAVLESLKLPWTPRHQRFLVYVLPVPPPPQIPNVNPFRSTTSGLRVIYRKYLDKQGNCTP